MNLILARLTKAVLKEKTYTEDEFEDYCANRNIQLFVGNLDSNADNIITVLNDTSESGTPAWNANWDVTQSLKKLLYDDGVYNDMISARLQDKVKSTTWVKNARFPYKLQFENIGTNTYKSFRMNFLYDTDVDKDLESYAYMQDVTFKGLLAQNSDGSQMIWSNGDVIDFTSTVFHNHHEQGKKVQVNTDYVKSLTKKLSVDYNQIINKYQDDKDSAQAQENVDKVLNKLKKVEITEGNHEKIMSLLAPIKTAIESGKKNDKGQSASFCYKYVSPAFEKAMNDFLAYEE